jgi:hypothetical protein
MPFDGPPFLTEEEIATIVSWIDAGARPSAPALENRPPVADPGGPYSTEVGVALTLSGAGSLDPDGDPLVFAWAFGDGNTGIGEMPQHVYATVGSFTVSLLVSDGERLSETKSTSVTVVPESLFSTDPIMERVCSQCHGLRIVLEDATRGEVTPPGDGLAFFQPGSFVDGNVRSAQAWRNTVARMRNVNGCQMTDSEEEHIVGFLAETYSGGAP